MASSSPRLFVVRPMGLEDIEVIAEWFENLDDLSLFDRNAPVPVGAESLREYWKADLAATPPLQRAYWYIARDAAGEPAAMGGLQSINYFHGDAVLPVFVAQPMRGQGIGLRMICMLLDLAFDRLRLSRVTTYYREDNQISARMTAKTAFTEEGRLRKAWHSNGRLFDMIVAGVLRDDWMKRRGELHATLGAETVLMFGHNGGSKYAWPAAKAPGLGGK